ncbi:centromere protein M [Bombina bombina]|uniref:centromere protein M n=1 Tax=Bombina bombina TaxID=8345 RepID=UPI00235AE05F|nr:centromere protein M [Bombina bombina]
MAALRPFDKLPMLNAAAVLLIGSEEHHLEQLAGAMLKEPKSFEVKIHMAPSLPLPYEREHLRPRFDMVVFLINLHSKYSLSLVLSSLSHMDTSFFLGKVCFLAIGGGQVKHCMVDVSTVKKLADTHLSTLLLSELDSEEEVMYTAQRLLRMLQICAGMVPGVSALYLGSLVKPSCHLSEI